MSVCVTLQRLLCAVPVGGWPFVGGWLSFTIVLIEVNVVGSVRVYGFYRSAGIQIIAP